MLQRVLYNACELRAGWRLLLAVAMYAALIFATTPLSQRLLRKADEITRFFAYETLNFIFVVVVSWVMGRIEGRAFGSYGLPRAGMFGARFWMGVVAGFASITALLVIMRGFGVFYFGHVVLHGGEIGKWALIWGAFFLLVGFREEFTLRGYALFTLTTGITFWPAALLTSFIFGFGHGGNSGEDWIGMFNAGLFGLFACFLLRRTGNLWLPIGFHAAWDWGETYFYGVADSGMVTPGHLLTPSSAGKAWLSGGTVGPEGSVLATLLLLVIWAICASWLRETKYPNPAAVRRAPAPEPAFDLTSGAPIVRPSAG